MTHRHEVTRKRVRYDAPGIEEVRVRRGIAYAAEPERTLDLYDPPIQTDGLDPAAVILVSGLRDDGAQRMLGCRINEMESFISWSRLLAASGLVAITYTTSDDPAKDLRSVLRYVIAESGSLGVDARRLGLLASSSHAPNALGLLMAEPRRLACAAFSYGFMLDLNGSTGVADAQKQWHFVNPAAGKTVQDLPHDIAYLVVRAGRDTFTEVNRSIDAFVGDALRRNLELTLVNHSQGSHAFDLEDESEQSRDVVKEILRFLRRKLFVADR